MTPESRLSETTAIVTTLSSACSTLDAFALRIHHRWLDGPVRGGSSCRYGRQCFVSLLQALIYLRPGSGEADTVYITYHDGGDTEVFAESVAAMVEKLRNANRTA